MDDANSSTDQLAQTAETGAWYPQRSGLRYEFVAAIEVVDAKTGKQIASTTANLSRYGCYVRTSTPLEPGAKVKVTIKYQGTTFRSDGEVVYAIPGAGMGLRFENESVGEVALNKWLRQLSNEVLGRVRESKFVTLSLQQKIVLISCIVALAAIVAGVLLWSGVLR